MQVNTPNSQAAELEPGVTDLGPLAWVLDELRKSLESAIKALRRFVRDAEQARGSDLAALDSSQLRIARQQLHQSVGALEMIGLSAPALLLRAMEAAAQKFVQQPEHCTTESSAKLERASFALTEYLQGVLSNRPVSSVSLFPQYREIQEIVRADRIHPADLWPHAWRWIDVELPHRTPAMHYGPEARAGLDQAMLRLMKGKAAPSAAVLRDLCLGFSAAQSLRQARIFWAIAAAYFEALAHDLIESDVYVKRATSRILLQYASLARGDEVVSDRLAHDLIFFCAQAQPSATIETPLLAAIRSAYGLNEHKFVNYELMQFGRFDPALLAQARKRINSAKEMWSALAGGDLTKFKNVADQFSLVTDSLVKLHPSSAPLAEELTRAVEGTVRLAQAPRIELAMEVATSIMYLEAAFEDLDPSDPQLAVRTLSLAQRLDGVRVGGVPLPLEIWMEELYGRVSDKQTMGSVVGELRISLGEVEKGLDAFFRDPADKAPLQLVPGQLSQMRGVLSVLGLDQAALTALRMRDSVEQLLETEVDARQARTAGTFDHLGNNVGALSFLIDMLNYQPALARKLFVFDEEKGELKPIMGRTTKRSRPGFGESISGTLGIDEPPPVAALAVSRPVTDLGELVDFGRVAESSTYPVEAPHVFKQEIEFGSSLQGVVEQEPSSHPALPYADLELSAQTAPGQFEEDDLQEIFIEEAREVTGAARDALARLVDNPADVGELTVLRRAFHTLKGSSRMVGLKEFGDAAWSFEQLNNSWLADHKPAGNDFRVLTLQAIAGLEAWIKAISSGRDAGWSALSFSTSADAMRLTGAYIVLSLGSHLLADQAAASEVLAPAEDMSELGLELGAEQDHDADQTGAAIDLDDLLVGDLSPEIVVVPEPFPALDPGHFDLSAIDFANLSGLPEVSLPDASAVTDLTQELPLTVEAQAIADLDFDLLFNGPETLDALEVVEVHEAAEPTFAASVTASDDISSQLIDVTSFFDTDIVEPEGLPSQLQVAPDDSMLAAFSFNLDPVPPEPDHLSGSAVGEGFGVSGVGPVSDDVQDAGNNSGNYVEEDSVEGSVDDEQVRVIGSLRIGIPLYNVYLNEADEWSRRLVTEVGEWAIEANRAVSDSTVALAHSLSGSSATVGFQPLSEIARALEYALQKSQLHYSGEHLTYSALFVDAAEEIRRLLHQFAAGFLKDADANLLVQLKNLDFPDSLPGPLNEPLDPDAFEADQAAQLASVRLNERPAALATYAADSGAANESTGVPEALGAFESVEAIDAMEVVESIEFSEQDQDDGATSAPESAFDPLAESSSATTVGLTADALRLSDRLVPPLSPLPVVLAGVGMDANLGLDSHVEGIDATDAIDPELFSFFEEEAAELMPQLGGALRQWSARPENESARMEVLRVLHTLKGSARLAGAMRLGEMSHRIESQIESLGSEPPPDEFDDLLTRFDAMQGNFDALRATAMAQPVLPPLVDEPGFAPDTSAANLGDEIDATLADWAAQNVPTPDLTQAPTAEPTQELAPELVVPEVPHLQIISTEGDALAHEAPQLAQAPVAADGDRKIAIPPPQAMVMATVRQAAGASVRVRSQLLDRMVNQAGEVMITRSRLEAELSQLKGSLGDMNANLNRLRQHLRDIELQAETQMQSRLAQAKEAQAGFDPLEIDRFTRVQELTRMMAESVNDVATVQRTLQRTVEATEDDLVAQARQTRELQRDLLRTRMVEFESISDRLYRVVRQASKDTGKPVKLDLVGGSIEMDRGMLDRVTPAFEHLLRNCVAHGIEDQPARIAAGKVPAGQITVQIRHEGNDVSVDFSDDGSGLNLNRIRERALTQGLIAHDKVLTEQDAADLIFLPGFTTAVHITELSGRGIGMDVVRSEVNALGGRIETSTVAGQGTHFKLILPLTTAVTQVVMIRSGQLSIGVPATVIETVRRVSPHDLQAAYATGSIDVAGTALPFFWSGTLLQASRQSTETTGRTFPVVIFRSADQRLALHVDEVVGNKEVVVKNLGPQMSRLPGLSGMSVLASGAVVLIYNPVALASIYGVQAQAWAALKTDALPVSAGAVNKDAAAASGAHKVPLILVVDDSITVRRVTQRLLQREGFRVAMAADGLQALERLQDEVPTVVLSDIEMPRMDGFDLARNIRADSRLKGLPIIMITSRIAEKHREHAMELGVDHYLGKPYSEEELMALVRHYCAAEAVLAA